jgi:hypothetical protein
MQLNDKQLARIAGFELNALNLSRVLPLSLEGARIEDAGTIIHDLDGEPLFRRIPLERQRLIVGHADVAVRDVFAEPLLAIHIDSRWSESSLLRRAIIALRQQNPGAHFDETRSSPTAIPSWPCNSFCRSVKWRCWSCTAG